MSFADKNMLRNWKNIELHNAYWGGEPAANLLDKHLTPEQFVIYSHLTMHELMKTYKLMPDDINGNILYMLPPFKNKEVPKIADPFIIYAELIESKDSRCLEAAQRIKEKYIDPPNTTEYGIMFLPYESLFGEVLRVPGLFEQLQKDYKITITGPTTLSALLNSLQMGFRTLTIEKRSGEVWELLGAVKSEFGKFGGIIEKTRDKLVAATKELDNTGFRTRTIERKLRQVQELPASETKLILDSSPDDESTEIIKEE
jgi:hypothetical protein